MAASEKMMFGKWLDESFRETTRAVGGWKKKKKTRRENLF